MNRRDIKVMILVTKVKLKKIQKINNKILPPKILTIHKILNKIKSQNNF